MHLGGSISSVTNLLLVYLVVKNYLRDLASSRCRISSVIAGLLRIMVTLIVGASLIMLVSVILTPTLCTRFFSFLFACYTH